VSLRKSSGSYFPLVQVAAIEAQFSNTAIRPPDVHCSNLDPLWNDRSMAAPVMPAGKQRAKGTIFVTLMLAASPGAN
jgi:hypothetical protein